MELSRAQIADAALALLDREGVDALTMRRLASELGIGTMTLYGYFRTKDELLDAAADRAAEEISIPPMRGPWRRRLRTLILEVHRVLRRHPGGSQLRAQRPLLSPGALRSTNAGLEILLGAGFSRAEAAHTWRLLFTYAFGFSIFSPDQLTDEDRSDLLARARALPADELPRVVEVAPEAVEAMAGEDTFLRGLDVILDGLEHRLERKRGRQR